MGLELVEIVMDVEETFGIALPDARCLRNPHRRRTARVHRRNSWAGSRRDLRRTDCARQAAERPDVGQRRSSGLDRRRHAAFDAVSLLRPQKGLEAVGRCRSLCRCRRSCDRACSSTFGIVVAIPLGWICGLAAILALDLPKDWLSGRIGGDSWPCAWIARDCGILACRSLADFSAGHILARGISHRRRSSQAILQMHYGRVVRREHGFSRDEVWCILQEIVAGVLGIDRERVTPEARFVEDLGPVDVAKPQAAFPNP